MRTRVLTVQQDSVGSLLKLGGKVKVEVAKRGIKVSQLKSGGYIVYSSGLWRMAWVVQAGMRTDP